MRIIKSGVILLLVLCAALLMLVGPRGNASVPDDRVVVDYWEKWTGNEESQMRQIVDAFNDTVGRDKGIFVRYLSTSSVNQKTLIATAAGVPPDIAGLWTPNVPQFAAMDALEPLDELAAAHGITAATYKPVFWEGCKYDGKLYALVSTPYNVALHYNKDLFAKRADALRAAGLDPDRAPRTLSELDAYASALDEVDARGNIIRTGYLPLEPGWYLDYTCLWFGGNWWDERNKRFTFTDPAVIRSYEWVQSYSKKLGKDAMTEFRTGFGGFDSPQNPFVAGTVAMVKQGTFMANFIHNLKPSMDGQWAAAPFPAAVPGLDDVTYCTADVLVIPRGARHKNEAFEFIAYVNRQDVMEKLCNLHCKTSPLANVSETFMTTHRNPHIRLFERLAASPNAHTSPPVPILPEVGAELNNFVQRLALLQTTPEEGLKEVQATLQAKYDQFMQRQQQRRDAGDVTASN
ncbi:MAG TPA: extracellular solute-binding protein [Tepidisphaeraceae bacterium]|nr:extracellular solute-binding protein [Tepidisphaeraceae bacterium]